jgi:arylsulfatase A-like enzyme
MTHRCWAPIARSRFGRLFAAALSITLIFWLPLAALQQADALLAFLTWNELAEAFALAVVMLVAASALMAAFSTGIGALLRPFSGRLADSVSFGLLVVPLGTLGIWQIGSAVQLWIDLVAGRRLSVGPLTKSTIVIVMVAVLTWQISRLLSGKATAMANRLTVAVRGTAPLAMSMAIAAAIWLVLHPPAFRWPHELQGNTTAVPRSVATAGSPPNILLVSIDSLSAADADLCDASSKHLMPNLRRLAVRSTCFPRFYASSNFTIPTTSTMETGLLPWTHWAVNVGAKLAPAQRTASLASSMLAAGYATRSVSENLLATPRHRGTWRAYSTEQMVASDLLLGRLSQGLTVFPDSALPMMSVAMFSLLSVADVQVNGTHNPYSANRVYDAGQALLNRADANGTPTFTWLHTMPPHSPYLPPESTRYRLLPAGQLDHWSDFHFDNRQYAPDRQPFIDLHRLRYRESIMGADESLGRLLDSLESSGWLDRAVVIVTADHGESFEKGFLGHTGRWLHESLIRIPLLIKLPGQRLARVIDTPVSQADLAPTVLELAGAKPLAVMEGRSLLPALQGQTLDTKPVFSMSLERASRFSPIRQGQIAMMDGSLKLIFDIGGGKASLYDLSADPAENNDLSEQRVQEAARMVTLVQRKLQAAETARAATFAR